MFGLFNCEDDRVVTDIIEDLHSDEDTVRVEGLTRLGKLKLSPDQEVLLLHEACNEFPAAQSEWQSIPGELVAIATKSKNPKLISAVRDNYSKYDQYAKTEALAFLGNLPEKNALLAFKELLFRSPEQVHYLSFDGLDENYSFKNILFPDLLKLVEMESIGADILLLFLDHLQAGQLRAADFPEISPKVLRLSQKYRLALGERQAAKIDVWEDETYQDARRKAGILEDLLGYFQDENTRLELREHLKLNDRLLMMFSAISLIKLGEQVSPEVLEKIAADPETRNSLYDNLTSLEKDGLFPIKYKTQEAFAESDMVGWLLYPTELARMPDAIELMQVVELDSESEDGMVEFYLFRFRSDHPDWKDKGWMAAVSGYYPKDLKPSTESMGYTFSEFEEWENKSPEEHVAEMRDLLDDANDDYEDE